MADKKPGDGAAEKLRRYWLTGEGGQIKVRWGEPGDWRRCVAQVSKFMSRDEAEGYCQRLHKAATGMYTGDKAHRDKFGK